MSIYSKNETGTRAFRSRLDLSYRKLFDCDFAKLIPFCTKFILPGDVAKIGAEAFIRYQPTIAPPLTRSWARFRWFFVPLRLVEPNAEKIITGSDDGHLIETELPTFNSVFVKSWSDSFKIVEKYSFGDYIGMPIGDYSAIVNSDKTKCLPADYWRKAYFRIWWDYYRDENLYDDFTDFDTFQRYGNFRIGKTTSILSPALHKDYFTSALPWQLKGVAPTFEITGGHVDFNGSISQAFPPGTSVNGLILSGNANDLDDDDTETPFAFPQTADIQSGTLKLIPSDEEIGNFTDRFANLLDNNSLSGLGSFNMDDIRTMAAQTRIFERLARCGSRYTEYLHANFGTAPADGTLQRAQYLGGFSQPIVTTEVVQTGGDTSEVGTLRGHGISSGGNSIGVHKFKEFGVLLGVMDVMPELIYTQGINREFTYKSRFDFFNPSFQHLSEQEVRNGELYVDFSDGKNDDTFGFQAIYNELRQSKDEVVGDMRDTLSYWQQGITFASRPELNNAFINAGNYLNDFKRPFQVLNGAMPIICDVGNRLDFWRPMVRYGTPGLVDHL